MNIVSGNARRYLALWLPYLPTDRLRRRTACSATPDDRPLVIVEKAENALRITAADPSALVLGLYPGLPLADARARVASLVVAKMDRTADQALLGRLADLCERYTPLVAPDPQDGLVFDITGCAHLFGGEQALGASLSARVTGLGFQARTCVAGTPDAARAACRYTQMEVVPAGGEEEALRPLPVAALGIAPDIVEGLLRAGLKTIGDLAGRPRRPLAARFGEALLDRLDRTLGLKDIRITPRRPVPACIVEQGFPEPVSQADYVRAMLARLTVEAGLILERRGEGGRRFEVGFFRADGAVRRIAVDTAMPTRDAAAVMRLLETRLESLADPLDPGFGFDLIRLSVIVTEPLAPAQLALDGGADGHEETAALTDRLCARFGSDSVLRFAPRDTHLPERMARAVPACDDAATRGGWLPGQAGEPPTRPLFLFDPPQPIETLAEVPDGPPLRFRWRRALHEVAGAEGPERIAPEWWRQSDDALNRDYYRIEDSDGRRFWVFREGLYGRETPTPRWFMHGLFA